MNNPDVLTERSADVLDIASHAEAVATAVARDAAKLTVMPEKARREDGTLVTQGQDERGYWRIPDCVECGQEIPQLRLELGRVRCVGCQTVLEKRRKGY